MWKRLRKKIKEERSPKKYLALAEADTSAFFRFCFIYSHQPDYFQFCKKGVAIIAGAAGRRLRKNSPLLSRIIPSQA
jgi:hypothetical protein